MKKASTIAAILVSALGGFAQQVTVSGTITNPAGEQVVISKQGLFAKKEISNVKLDEQGRFQTTFDIEQEGYYSFKHGREHTTMYLAPGFDLTLALNPEEFDESITYSGTGSAENNYLASKYLLDEKQSVSGKELYSLPIEDFITRTNQLRNIMDRHFIESVVSDSTVSKQFQMMEAAELLYNWANMRINYPKNHKYYTKGEFTPNGNYDAFLDKLSFNSKELIELTSYTRFLKTYFNREAEALVVTDPKMANVENARMKAQFSVIEKYVSNQQIGDYLMASIIYDKIKYKGINGLENTISEFEERCKTLEYIKVVKDESAKWQHLTQGSPAPNFTYTDINGKEISLSDFKGNYVYVDVCASWCGPCRREMPKYKALMQEFKGQNIVFIGVSVDDSKEAWKKMLEEEELQENQLFAKGFKSQIARDYNIYSIPRFILIDREGNIINANAARPSGEIQKIIESLQGIKGSG